MSRDVTADACRKMLDAVLAGTARLETDALASLAAAPADAVDDALRDFAAAHGADALPILATLGSERASREVRRAAKRALYRLSQRGVNPPAPPPPRPIVEREAERALRAWVSGIDGTGSRAVWVVFQGGFGGMVLASLVLNDTAGILDASGGDITKKRLEAELTQLRTTHSLPWVETDPARVMDLVTDALAIHAAQGTSPPAAFARLEELFKRSASPDQVVGGLSQVPSGLLKRSASPDQVVGGLSQVPSGSAPVTQGADPGAVERSAELLDLPELTGWFLDPEALQSDALALLQARESRLVVPDQVKAERETAVVDAVIERELAADGRRRWARRLSEMALIFRATERPEQAGLADAAAIALADDARDPRRHPFARELAKRGVEAAAEATLGRVSMSEISRRPTPVQSG